MREQEIEIEFPTPTPAGRRSRRDISVAILRRCRGGARKTHIVYDCNLNFAIVNPYLKDLMDRGLIYKKGVYYYTTKAGLEAIARYEALVTIAG